MEGGREGGGQVQPQPKDELNLWNLASVKIINPALLSAALTLEIFRFSLIKLSILRFKCCSGFYFLINIAVVILLLLTSVCWVERNRFGLQTNDNWCNKLCGHREVLLCYYISLFLKSHSLLYFGPFTLLHKYKWHFCVSGNNHQWTADLLEWLKKKSNMCGWSEVRLDGCSRLERQTP